MPATSQAGATRPGGMRGIDVPARPGDLRGRSFVLSLVEDRRDFFDSTSSAAASASALSLRRNSRSSSLMRFCLPASPGLAGPLGLGQGRCGVGTPLVELCG
jgi:hypothetical protein